MMCFRDKSFCNQSHDCANEACPHHFGDDDKAAAIAWWGGDDAPVAYMNRRTQDCGYVERARIAGQEKP